MDKSYKGKLSPAQVALCTPAFPHRLCPPRYPFLSLSHGPPHVEITSIMAHGQIAQDFGEFM